MDPLNIVNNFKAITACRMCGNQNLVNVIDLGNQYLTGVFPRMVMKDSLTMGPLRLVKCHDGKDACGLLQLEHSYELDEMYGENYGYRSGLNSNMVKHLHGKINAIRERVDLKSGDLVIDIGSNDGTSLAAYPEDLLLVGIDPTGEKLRNYYKPHINLVPDFFSAGLVSKRFPGKKAEVVTSFSMLYDLEDPLAFARDIASILDPEAGLWVFEQSYMPLMLERIAFDTVCHEHLEYYGLKQIVWLADRAGLKIIDAELNDVNGGSISVVAALQDSIHKQAHQVVQNLLDKEDSLGLSTLKPYQDFGVKIDAACLELRTFIADARKNGKRVCGLGASTKGNVLLQYCGLTSKDIEVIGEVNKDKFGSLTPGSWIPIDDEAKVLESKADYLIVLPWHFKEFFLRNPAFKGQRLVFPLPSLEVVSL
jgi:hypothetical protein